MRVLHAPAAVLPREILGEIVRPHGIDVVEGPGGSLVLVRSGLGEPEKQRAVEHETSAALAEVVVTASRYELIRAAEPSLSTLTTAELEQVPNVGDDPLRTVARLPGTATNDYSARVNIRGGNTDETLVLFDGLRLYNPFHLKDFQGVLSAIDPAIIRTIDVYTGGFPARFGDRMSGVIDIAAVDVNSAWREIAVSPYNVSAFAAGQLNSEKTSWLLSGRRGNLDLVLDLTKTKLGRPTYVDIYGRANHRLSDALSVAANFLLFDEDISLNDSDVEEHASAEYRDRYGWLRFDYVGPDALRGSLLLSRSEFESLRSGDSDKPGIGRGALYDRREHTIDTLHLDATWRMSGATVLEAGAEWRRSSGHYEFGAVSENDLIFIAPGAPAQPSRAQMLRVRPDGDQQSLYSTVRFELAPNLIADGGLRWDRSTLAASGQRSSGGSIDPRISILYRSTPRTGLRASWGRFSQLQSIDELQIPDGVVEFGSAQRADHWLLSGEYSFASGPNLRVEAYRKEYDSPQPSYENLLNPVVLLPEIKPDRIRVAPVRSEARGVEVSLRQPGTGPLFWWASYTWSYVRDTMLGEAAPRSWDQRHAVSAAIGWENNQWQITVAGAYHSGWPTTTVELREVDGVPIAFAPKRNNSRLGAYAELDLRIARRFDVGDNASLSVFFELSNMLNRGNDCCVEYEIEDDEGPQFLELETLPALPLLPSVGFVWRF